MVVLMKYEFNVNKLEKKRLLYYAEQVLFESSHWGDGDAFVPEEKLLLDQFKNDKKKIKISDLQLKILVNWFIYTTGSGSFLMNDDSSILNKIIVILKEYYKKNNNDYKLQSDTVKNKISFIKKIFPGGLPIQVDKRFIIHNTKK